MNEIPLTPPEPSIPIAKIVEPMPRTERWILASTVAGLLLLVAMLIYGNTGRYQVIAIRFSDGHGLKPGDPIRHRGIDVGRAVSVELDPSLSNVVVKCELFPGAEQLARSGSQFWIVRPSVSLSGVQGLDTIVGGRYLSVVPGPASAKPRTEFEGLSESPGSAALLDGGLEIALEAPQRFGLDRGTPLLFRGMRVGEVVSVALASDSLTVEARAVVAADYRSLVRDNSVFWKDSGVNMHLGLRGFDLDVGTLESFAAGGVAFATPDPPGAAVHTGHRFHIEAKEVDEWREWRPKLVVGSASLPAGRLPPTMLPAELLTTRRQLGLTREVRTGTWLLPLADGRIVGPASVLDQQNHDTPARLAFAGIELSLDEQTLERYGDLSVFRPTESVTDGIHPWPKDLLRAPTEPEDCLLFADLGNHPIPLSRGRFSVVDSQWTIDPAVAIGADFLGGALVSRQDGALVGLIDVRDDHPIVLPIPQELAAE